MVNFEKIVADRCKAKPPSKLKHLQKHRRVWVAGKPRGLCAVFVPLSPTSAGGNEQLPSNASAQQRGLHGGSEQAGVEKGMSFAMRSRRPLRGGAA